MGWEKILIRKKIMCEDLGQEGTWLIEGTEKKTYGTIGFCGLRKERGPHNGWRSEQVCIHSPEGRLCSMAKRMT